MRVGGNKETHPQRYNTLIKHWIEQIILSQTLQRNWNPSDICTTETLHRFSITDSLSPNSFVQSPLDNSALSGASLRYFKTKKALESLHRLKTLDFELLKRCTIHSLAANSLTFSGLSCKILLKQPISFISILPLCT